MIFKDLKQVKKYLEENGHSMIAVDESLMCENCNRWAKHRNDGGHAWGDCIGSQCVNNKDTMKQQPDATVNPPKKQSLKK